MGLIVLDKSFLLGNNADTIRDLCGQHTTLVTYELLYELGTDSRGRSPQPQLDKLAGMNVAQGYAIFKLIGIERQNSVPTVSIIDPSGSSGLQDCLHNPQSPLDIHIPKSLQEMFDVEPVDCFRKALDRMWAPAFNCVFEHARGLAANGADAEAYVKLTEQLTSQQIGEKIACSHHMSALPDSRWVLYWFERLRNYLAFRWRVNGVKPDGLSCKIIVNELMDLHYVTILPWADGIGTYEKSLQSLVREFFPKKLILPEQI